MIYNVGDIVQWKGAGERDYGVVCNKDKNNMLKVYWFSSGIMGHFFQGVFNRYVDKL